VALLAGAALLFIAAAAGVSFASVQAMRQAAMALNPRRPAEQRRARAFMAALFALGVIASATLGYLGIVALMYYAQA